MSSIRWGLLATSVFLGMSLGCCRSLTPESSRLPPVEGLVGVPVASTSVVLVHVPDGLGSGWVLTDNLIVTCRHVVMDVTMSPTMYGPCMTETQVDVVNIETSEGFVMRADIIGVSDKYDVAVLRVQPPQWVTLSPLSLATDMPQWGQFVQVIGYPDGVGPRLMVGRIDQMYDETSVSTTVPSMGGASGSPLLDYDGAVCGQLHSAYRSSHRAICDTLDNLRRGIEECLHGPEHCPL